MFFSLFHSHAIRHNFGADEFQTKHASSGGAYLRPTVVGTFPRCKQPIIPGLIQVQRHTHKTTRESEGDRRKMGGTHFSRRMGREGHSEPHAFRGGGKEECRKARNDGWLPKQKNHGDVICPIDTLGHLSVTFDPKLREILDSCCQEFDQKTTLKPVLPSP